MRLLFVCQNTVEESRIDRARDAIAFWSFGGVMLKIRFLVRIVFFMMTWLLLGCGRIHPLQDGEYAFSVQQILRDDCDLSNSSTVFSSARLITTGHQVRLDFAPPGTSLIGTYRSGVEEMTLDGTITNFNTVVGDRECLVDVASLHLDAETIDATSFRGSMSIAYDARAPDACVCRFWFLYEARRDG